MTEPTESPWSPPNPATGNPEGGFTTSVLPPERRLSGRHRLWLVLAAILILIGGVVIGLAVAGSSDDGRGDTTAADADAPALDGSRLVHGKGLAVRVPAGWRAVPLNEDDMRSFLEAAGKENPQWANVLSEQMQAAVAQNIKFFAVREDTAGEGFAVNVNILTVPAAGGLSQLAGQAEAELSQLGATQVDTTDVVLPQGDAVRSTYTYFLGTGAERMRLRGTQYYVPFGSEVAVVTLTTGVDDTTAAAALDFMVRSLRLD